MQKLRQFRRASVQSGTTDGVKISGLPAATTTSDLDQLEANQGGTSRRVTLDQIATAAAAPLLARTAAVTYYVATTGSDANDGAVAESPVLTFQKALDLCAATAAYSRGPFTIQASAGTYNLPAQLAFSGWLFAGCPITFKGHVGVDGVPDVIVLGSTDGTRTKEFIRANGVTVTIQDFYFKSFSAVASGGTNGIMQLTRCWALNCRNVLSPHNGGHAGAQGGNWDGRDLAGVMIEDGWAFSSVIVGPFNLAQTDYNGLLIHHFEVGVLVDECGSGHIDYLRIEDCINGLWIIRGGGSPNMINARIWRCTRGVLAEDTSALQIASIFDFGQGTANACIDNIVNCAGPVTPQARETNYSSRPVYLVYQVTSGGTLTGSVDERNVFNPLINVYRGRVRLCDVLDVHLYTRGNLTTAGTLRLYFGATMVKSWVVPTGTQTSRIEINLEALNATDWRGQICQIAGVDGSAPSTLLTALDPDSLGITSKTADTVLSLTWQAGALADTFRVRTMRIYSSIAGVGFP